MLTAGFHTNCSMPSDSLNSGRSTRD
jgi:hypothetical protein